MAWQDVIKSKIEEIVLSFIDRDILDLVEINVHKTKSATVIQVLMDRHEGGVNIDECAAVNVHINRELEQSDVIDGDYTVEVSSPGLDRPLKTYKDFKRNSGQRVRVHLSELVEGKCEWAGTIVDVNEEHVRVETKNENIQIPIKLVTKAYQIID